MQVWGGTCMWDSSKSFWQRASMTITVIVWSFIMWNSFSAVMPPAGTEPCKQKVWNMNVCDMDMVMAWSSYGILLTFWGWSLELILFSFDLTTTHRSTLEPTSCQQLKNKDVVVDKVKHNDNTTVYNITCFVYAIASSWPVTDTLNVMQHVIHLTLMFKMHIIISC